MIVQIRDVIWGMPLLLFILGTGLFLTLRLRGLQFRYLAIALGQIFRPTRTKQRGDISRFQALMTSLAGTIGIGNIAGVALAITAGGVGAMFWMVLAALLGMATSYAESYLALRYRVADKNGQMSGGPMYTLERGLRLKWLAVVFAVAGTITALFTGNMIQANSVTDITITMLPVERWQVGLFLALISGVVLIGGIRQIGRVSSVLIPVMALIYLIGGGIILVMRYDQLIPALWSMVQAAFHPQAALGGAAGASMLIALRMGVARGILASEAGLGSSPIAAAAAKTDMPGSQAIVSMTGAFISVCIVCLLTGLVLSVTGVLGTPGVTGVPLTAMAFDAVLPFGRWVVFISAFLFGYTTIVGWAYYGEKCCEYLFGGTTARAYRFLYTSVVLLGAVMHVDVVWSLADIANAMMVVPNLIAVLALSGIVARETVPFLKRLAVVD